MSPGLFRNHRQVAVFFLVILAFYALISYFIWSYL